MVVVVSIGFHKYREPRKTGSLESPEPDRFDPNSSPWTAWSSIYIQEAIARARASITWLL